MAKAGYIAPNIAKNVSIAHGVRMFFQRDTGSSWFDLGDVTDLSVNPVAEFLDYMSNHDGQNAIAKRVLQNRGVTIEATLNEVNEENLQLMWLGGTYATGSINYVDQELVTGVAGGPWTLENFPAGDVVTAVTLEDGTEVPVADYTVGTGNGIITAASSPTVLVSSVTKINVQYTVAMTGAQKTEILDDTTFTGAVQFQIMNQSGGVSQIIELDSCFVSPSGALSLPADGLQTLPITIQTLTKNNKVGRAYFKTV